LDFGPVDISINSISLALGCSFLEQQLDTWDFELTIKINLASPNIRQSPVWFTNSSVTVTYLLLSVWWWSSSFCQHVGSNQLQEASRSLISHTDQHTWLTIPFQIRKVATYRHLAQTRPQRVLGARITTPVSTYCWLFPEITKSSRQRKRGSDWP
jgi:hypothetical protein